MSKIKSIKAKDLTIFKISGHITMDELIKAISNFYRNSPTKFTIWDITKSTISHFESEDIKNLSNFAKSYSHLRKGGKTAIIVSKTADFGMGRMLETYSKISEILFEVKTFYDYPSVSTWFGIKLPDSDKTTNNDK